MRARIVRFVGDAFFWTFCIVLIGFLDAAGAVDDPAFGLAAGALWWGIRAHSKAEVNTAHKNSVEV